MRTGFLWHELFAWYDAGAFPAAFLEPAPALDTPESKRRFRNLVEASGLLHDLILLKPAPASDEVLLRVHDAAYLDLVTGLSEGSGGEAGPYAHLPKGGMAIARLSAGGAIAVVDAVMTGMVDNAYALVRPAGHHATRSQGMGFCILNNAAVAAAHALAAYGLDRVAIVDWDVHHGNGLQEIFWDEARVLTISIHQDGLFTLSGGSVDEAGSPAAFGANLNVPLPAGSGHSAYLEAMQRIVVPALERFQPQLVLVASGLDALFRDPLGRMMLHSGSYREMTRRLMAVANEVCGGRLAFVHEGGYSATVVPFAGLAIVEELSQRQTAVVDPFLRAAQKMPGQALTRDQSEAIQLAGAGLDRVPRWRPVPQQD